MTKTDQHAGVTSNYTYDALYELTQVTQNANTTESYTYDPVGNRVSSLGLSPYVNNTSNELTSTPNAGYTYDYNGNTTSRTDSTGTTNYTWDYENRLTSVTLPGTGGSVTFKYDPFGRRIQKVFTQNSTTTTTNYLYDGSNAVEDLDQSGSLIARYAQTQNIDEPLAEQRSGTTSYYEADGLGSVTSLTSSAGAIANTYTYDSFGRLTASTGSISNRFQYTAREFDSETGLYYYRARYYDPSTGRFTSEDSEGFDAGPNFYRYVSNNTLNEVDPFGLADCFYRISTHMLRCVSRKNRGAPPVIVGPTNVSSGNGACKDNPKCADKLFTGPIKPGGYKMNPDTRKGQTDRYRLEPDPPIPGWKVDLGLERGGFELHPGHRTLGCINVLKDDPNAMNQYQQLQQLLDSETGSNYLVVAP
jgi:RHS repeat-associated protein